jgi:hypothetical protein
MGIPPETLFLPAIVFIFLYLTKQVPKPRNPSPSAIILIALVLAVIVTNLGDRESLLTTCGYYCILDGFISILMYRPDQTIDEHVPRVLRTLIGLLLLMI